jgi:hypothetical protein
VEAHFGRLPDLHVKIGSFSFDDDVKKLVNQDTLVRNSFGHSVTLKGLAGDADDFLENSAIIGVD